MTEIEPRQDAIDRLLRRSLAASIPSLPPDFEQRVLREVRHGSRPLARYRQVLLAGYGLASVVVSAIVMRGQGLGWGPIAGMTMAPLALLAAVRAIWRGNTSTARHTAR